MERPSSLCFKLNVVPSSDFRKIGDLRLFTRRSIRMKMIHISDTNWHRCHSFPCKRNNLSKRPDATRAYRLRQRVN